MKLDQLKFKIFVGAIMLFLAFPSLSFVKDVQSVEKKFRLNGPEVDWSQWIYFWGSAIKASN